MEYKAFHSVNKISGRTVTGIAAVFGNVDAYNDRIHPGAFTKTINENMRRVRFLWQHDATQPPIARIDAVREVSKDELPDALRGADGVIGGLEVTRTYLETPRAE
jgi:phage head maturation protease